jgi:hypothetical protein
MNSRRCSSIAPLCRIIYPSDSSCVYIFLAESCAAVDSSAGRSSKAQNICIRICIRIYVCIYKCTFVCTAKAWKKTRRGNFGNSFSVIKLAFLVEDNKCTHMQIACTNTYTSVHAVTAKYDCMYAIFIDVHTYKHTDTQTNKHTYIHTYMHAYIYTYNVQTYESNQLYTYLHSTCIHMYTNAYMQHISTRDVYVFKDSEAVHLMIGGPRSEPYFCDEKIISTSCPRHQCLLKFDDELRRIFMAQHLYW